MVEQSQKTDIVNKQDTEVVVVDLSRLWKAVRKKAWVVCLVAVLSAALAFAGTLFLITPMYQSSALFYVNNSSISVGDAALSISSGDISASKSLVESYIVILKTRESLMDVIEYSGVDRTYGEVKGMISAASVNSTEIFRVTVTSPDPQEAEQIANAIAYVLPKRISNVVEGSSAKVVDHAVVPSSPSSPSYTNNTMLGLMIGLVFSVGIIALVEIFDVTIKEVDDVQHCTGHPILASVPDVGVANKDGGYYSRKYTGKYAAVTSKAPALFGPGISFLAAEAYKLLRTKLQFSFADGSNSRVIGVSSAMAGEGKSVSSVNLAYSLAQLDKKVLLVDCDMRRPTLAEKISVQKTPGLANYLVGQTGLEQVFQSTGLGGDAVKFDVISAGSTPPNPIELLGSQRMHNLLQQLRESYDYIILDLPPVGEVSDALVATKMTDGMLLVVRQNYCNRLALADAVRQFEFVEARILGILVNCTSEGSGAYGRKYKYYKYGNRYSRYGRYGNSAADGSRTAAAVSERPAGTVRPGASARADHSANQDRLARPARSTEPARPTRSTEPVRRTPEE